MEVDDGGGRDDRGKEIGDYCCCQGDDREKDRKDEVKMAEGIVEKIVERMRVHARNLLYCILVKGIRGLDDIMLATHCVAMIRLRWILGYR